VVLYLAFLPLWWYSLQPLAAVSGAAANIIYRLFDSRISIVADGRVVRVLVAASHNPGAQPQSSALRLDTVTYGLPMLAALVIVTRADSKRRKLLALSAGLGVMVALTVPVVMAFAKLTSLEADELGSGPGTNSSVMFDAMHGYAFSQPDVAVVIWLPLMMLGGFRDRASQNAPAAAIARNAACPCGSGRKYKRCCGRLSRQQEKRRE